MVITGVQQLVCLYLEIAFQVNGTIFHIIDVGTYAIHTIGWLDGNHVVNSWFAEYTIAKVYCFVGTIT